MLTDMIDCRRVTVVMPAFNAEKTLARTLAEINRTIVDSIVFLTMPEGEWERDERSECEADIYPSARPAEEWKEEQVTLLRAEHETAPHASRTTLEEREPGRGRKRLGPPVLENVESARMQQSQR